MEPTSEERILAGFSHLMILVGWYGPAISLAIWLVRRNKSDFIKQNVKQAMVYQILTSAVLNGISYMEGQKIAADLSARNVPVTPQIIGIVWVMVVLGLLLYGVSGAAANFRGKNFKYALIGNLIDRYL